MLTASKTRAQNTEKEKHFSSAISHRLSNTISTPGHFSFSPWGLSTVQVQASLHPGSKLVSKKAPQKRKETIQQPIMMLWKFSQSNIIFIFNTHTHFPIIPLALGEINSLCHHHHTQNTHSWLAPSSADQIRALIGVLFYNIASSKETINYVLHA